jgi:bilirubin oxidase
LWICKGCGIIEVFSKCQISVLRDGGLLEHSIKANTLRLAPAERVEILVDVSDGGRPILQHAAAQESSSMGGMGMMGGMMNNERQDMDIFQIDASDTLKSTGSIPKNS